MSGLLEVLRFHSCVVVCSVPEPLGEFTGSICAIGSSVPEFLELVRVLICAIGSPVPEFLEELRIASLCHRVFFVRAS